MKPLAWALLAAVFYLFIPTLGRTARNEALEEELVEHYRKEIA